MLLSRLGRLLQSVSVCSAAIIWLNRLPQSIAHSCRQITMAQHSLKSQVSGGATRELRNCTFIVSLLKLCESCGSKVSRSL